MKKIKFLVLIFAAALISSCDVGNDTALNYGNGSYITQFPYASKTELFPKDAGIVYDYSVPIELVGGNGKPLNSDITLSYVLDESNTAVEGTNFDFDSAATSTVIPAGSTFSTIKVKIYSASLDDQNPPILALKLTAADASGNVVAISGNKNVVQILLQGTCTSDLAGSYVAVTTRLGNGAITTWSNEIIDEIGDGQYNTTTVGQYYAPGGDPGVGPSFVLGAASDAGYDFNEVCGRILVGTQNLAHVYSNEVRQSATQYTASTVNPATGVITIEYSVFFTGNTVERPFRSVYTPL